MTAFCQTGYAAREPSDISKKIADLEKKVDGLTRQVIKLGKNQQIQSDELDRMTHLEIGGFFDVSISNYKNKPDVFALGNFELDLKRSYDNNFQVAAALVFDDVAGTYLGVGFIDYSLYGDTATPRGHVFIDKGFHIQVGRFDVPLGNDWIHVSAVDRLTVTPPLTTEYLMEGVYNDVGIRFLLNQASFNLSVYMTHGVEEQHSYGGTTAGLRLGITPFSNPYSILQNSGPTSEIGLSYLYDVDRGGERSDVIWAIDYENRTGPLYIRGEYYNRDKTAGVIFDGYHITSGFDFEKIFTLPIIAFLRFDYHREQNNVIASYTQAYSGKLDQADSLSRVTVGTNINISNISYLKIEYHSFTESTEQFTSHEYFSKDLYYAQLVITF
jgi:hypothetical protein